MPTEHFCDKYKLINMYPKLGLFMIENFAKIIDEALATIAKVMS